MANHQITLTGLPYVAMDPQWLLESPAFLSGDARLVRAVPKLLLAAWGFTPAGSVPADVPRLAAVAGLEPAEASEHYEALTEGWELRDGRLHHIGMSALAQTLAERHGAELEGLAARAALAVQAPDDFVLVGDAAEPKKRGRHRLPKSFALTDAHRLMMAEKAGIRDPRDQEYVFNKFTSWARADNEMYTNWDSTLENFTLKEHHRNLPSRQTSVVPTPGRRQVRFGNAGGEALDHNLAAVGRAMERRPVAEEAKCP